MSTFVGGHLGFGESPSRRGPPAVHTASLMRADYPTYPLSNVWEEAQSHTDVVYLALRSLAVHLSSADPCLMRRRKPAVTKSVGGHRDEQYAPIQSHPFADVLRRPNPREPFSSFQARCLLQRNLHGRLLVWGIPNGVGAPTELYVLPTAMTTPLPPSQLFPAGAWRLTGAWPGAAGYIPGGGFGEPIDAREVFKWDDPHALYPWVPYSPMQGAGRQADMAEHIDRTAWALLQNAPTLSGIYDLPGASQEELEAVEARWHQKKAGPENAGRTLFVGGDRGGDGKAGTYSPLTPSLKDSPLAADREWYTSFVLAVFGLSLETAGIKADGGSYAKVFAELKRLRLYTLEPWCRAFGEFLTHHPCERWFPGSKGGVVVRVELPPLEDTDITEKRVGDGSQVFTVNERRAMAHLPPLPGGDVLAATYAAVEQQQHAPQPDPMGGGMPGQGGAPGAGGEQGASGGAKPPGQPEQQPQGQPAGNPAALEDHVARQAVAMVTAGGKPGGPPVRKGTGWDEGRHKRDAGKFSSTGGASGGGQGGGSSSAADISQSYAEPVRAAANFPGGMEHLQRVREWADRAAAQHADTVAQKLGIHPHKARRILEQAIMQLATHAAKHGGAMRGTLKVGGRQVGLNIGGPQKQAPGKPGAGFAAAMAGAGLDRPRNKDGKGSLPPRQKAMSALTGSDGGFLSPPDQPRRRRRKRKLRAADVRRVCKAVFDGLGG